MQNMPKCDILFIISLEVSINRIARDILTTADGSKEIRNIITDTFFRLQSFINVRMLINRIAVIIVCDII